jgi:hypothetical protein
VLTGTSLKNVVEQHGEEIRQHEKVCTAKKEKVALRGRGSSGSGGS